MIINGFGSEHYEKIGLIILFEYFKVNKDNNIRNTPQLVGGILIMRKCKNVMDIFTDCLNVVNDETDF